MFAVVLATFSTAPASARKKPVDTWQVMRTADPITGSSTCAVVASDHAAGLRFTQTGGLYPVVENNSTFGLLVGVSSGGRIRMPTGDIVWRVDDKPFRTLRAVDNPAAVGPVAGDGTDTVAAVTAQTLRLVRGLTSTSTMAGGDAARDMLAEMMSGTSLLFRAAAATQQTGIPDYDRLSVGQITSAGLRPYPLDASFRAGLAACGIAPGDPE